MKDMSIQTQFSCSDELCEYMSEKMNGTCLLSFSRGKDSVVSWLKLRRYFKKIVPFFLYPIPPEPLSFEEKSLQYYEDFFETRIIRLPHPSNYRLWGYHVSQLPHNGKVIDKADLPQFGYDVIRELIYLTDETLKGAYTAVGVRMADSVMRRTAIKRYGSVNIKDMKFYPCYDYLKADMIRELDEANIALPIDYEWFGRTFDGHDYRFIRPLKEKSPEDYQRVLDAFPLACLDFNKMQFRKEHLYGLEEAVAGRNA